MGSKVVLLTGSSGFLGNWLSAALCGAGHYVLGVDRLFNPDVKLHQFIRHDLLYPFEQTLPRFDVCIHLASASGGFLKNATDESLVSSELKMLEHVRKICALSACNRIIYTSSTNVFEISGVQGENALTKLNQKSPYARAKALGEAYISQAFANFTILRPTNYFGPAQPAYGHVFGDSHVIPELIRKINGGGPVQIFGDGKQRRNFLHLSDLTAFILKTLIAPHSQFVHLRSDIFISIYHLALELMRIMNTSRPIVYEPEYLKFEPAPITEFPCHNAEKLGWKPKVASLQEGLQIDNIILVVREKGRFKKRQRMCGSFFERS